MQTPVDERASGRLPAAHGARGKVSVPFHVPFLGEEETRAAVAALRAGSVGGGGAYSRQVEAQLRTLLKIPHAFFVTSCTHALELALMALGLGPGDEVVLPSFTFPSTATCVLRQGAIPVFADVAPDTWIMGDEEVSRCLSAKTRATILVHYAGHPAPAKEIAARLPAGCLIIEDAAHAFGAMTQDGRAAGTLGDAGCFSFHVTKNLTCGEGGALVLSDPTVAQRAEYIREKGTNRSQFLRGEIDRYSWVSEGSSYVASDLLAAVLVEQLKKSALIYERRRAIWHRYAERLAPLAARGGLQLPILQPGVQSSYHIFAILVAPDRRDGLRQQLLRRGIETTSHYVPLHTSPYWRHATRNAQRPLPVTERIGRSLLRLPIYPSLEPAQQDLVIDTLYELLPA